MNVIPAIDISEGKVVRLFKGDFSKKTVYEDDILKVAKELIDANSKRLHLVDLDASKIGKPTILDTVRKIRLKYPSIEIEIGGGIRTEHDVKRYVELDCDVIFGTAVIDDFQFVKEMSQKYKNRIIIGLDCLNGIVKTKGWENSTKIKITDVLTKIITEKVDVKKVIYTNIDKDGTLNGINFLEYEELKNAYPSLDFIISGGVKDDNDIKTALINGFDCIVGKALYSGLINLEKVNAFALIKSLTFDKDGLIPAVVQDSKTNQVLMVAYMNEESLMASIEEKRTVFYSRSRNAIWRKGETSGHIQDIDEILYDCDADTLLVRVRQNGVACHTGNMSCFHNNLVKMNDNEIKNENIIRDLYEVIKEYKKNRKPGSYTSSLFDAGISKITKKFGEEAVECVISSLSCSKEDTIGEISDLIYHLLVLMNELEISPDDILKCLSKRKR